MVIWKNIATIEQLNAQTINTLAQTLDIQFIEIGDDYLKASMPITPIVHQPYGILHGGASAALAETVGSVASWMCIDDQHICVGMEINCNHIKSIKSGQVIATARSFHLGATSHVWDIQIRNENEKLICVSRLTMAILKKKNR